MLFRLRYGLYVTDMEILKALEAPSIGAEL